MNLKINQEDLEKWLKPLILRTVSAVGSTDYKSQAEEQEKERKKTIREMKKQIKKGRKKAIGLCVVPPKRK